MVINIMLFSYSIFKVLNVDCFKDFGVHWQEKLVGSKKFVSDCNLYNA